MSDTAKTVVADSLQPALEGVVAARFALLARDETHAMALGRALLEPSPREPKLSGSRTMCPAWASRTAHCPSRDGNGPPQP